MATAQPSLVWFVARGSGWIAYLLLTAAVALGIGVGRRWHSERWPRLTVAAAHTWITLLFYTFLLVHTVTILLDPFTHFGLRDVVIPFAGAYRTLWLGLGILAGELAVAIGASVWLRPWIGYRAWRGLHLLTYALFPLSLLHSAGTGSDTTTAWGAAIYAGSALLIVGLLLWRLGEWRVWRRRALFGSLIGLLALGIWALRGPYASGWSLRAGTPPTLLRVAAQQRGASAVTVPAGPVLPGALDDTVAGQVQVSADGNRFLLLGNGQGSAPLDVAIQVTQSRQSINGQIQLRTAAHVPLCAGPITGTTQETLSFTCAGYGRQMQLQVTLNQFNAAGFGGTLQGSAQSASNAGAGTAAPSDAPVAGAGPGGQTAAPPTAGGRR